MCAPAAGNTASRAGPRTVRGAVRMVAASGALVASVRSFHLFRGASCASPPCHSSAWDWPVCSRERCPRPRPPLARPRAPPPRLGALPGPVRGSERGGRTVRRRHRAPRPRRSRRPHDPGRHLPDQGRGPLPASRHPPLQPGRTGRGRAGQHPAPATGAGGRGGPLRPDRLRSPLPRRLHPGRLRPGGTGRAARPRHLRAPGLRQIGPCGP